MQPRFYSLPFTPTPEEVIGGEEQAAGTTLGVRDWDRSSLSVRKGLLELLGVGFYFVCLFLCLNKCRVDRQDKAGQWPVM